MPEFETNPDIDDETPDCDDIGQEHTWGRWSFSKVAPMEIRFCQLCGTMQMQDVTE